MIDNTFPFFWLHPLFSFRKDKFQIFEFSVSFVATAAVMVVKPKYRISGGAVGKIEIGNGGSNSREGKE